MYKRRTTVAGRTIINQLTDSCRIKTEKKVRKAKCRPTSISVEKVNRINRERDLTIKINYNYRPGDLWIVFSYPEVLPIKECMRRIEKLKRNLRNLAKRKNIPFRLIESTGIGENGKPHHHLVLNQEFTRKMIIKYWPEEQIHIESLWQSGNYNRVAKYMLKNAYEAKTKTGKHSKAFRCSRTIITPETREEVMKRPLKQDPEDLRERKGYYIDKDTIRQYEHPITEAWCIEYIEVALDEDPRLKRYTKGKKARKESMLPEDEQLILEYIDTVTGGKT